MRSKLTIITWKEGKQWVSRCLNVEVASCGDTKKEALKNIEEALDLYFEEASAKHSDFIRVTDAQVHSLQHA